MPASRWPGQPGLPDIEAAPGTEDDDDDPYPWS